MNLGIKNFQLYDCAVGKDDKEYYLTIGQDNQKKWVLADWNDIDDCNFRNLKLDKYSSSLYESSQKSEKKIEKKKFVKPQNKAGKKPPKIETKPDQSKLPKKRGRPKKNPTQSNLNVEVKIPEKPKRGRPPKNRLSR